MDAKTIQQSILNSAIQRQSPHWFSINGTQDPKLWFHIVYNRWFLRKSADGILQGANSWFENPDKIDQQINPFRNKMDIRLIRLDTSKNPELLDKYYTLRGKAYARKLGLINYGAESSYDKTADILLQVYKRKVIAGARLDFSTQNWLMANEDQENSFYYNRIIKKFDPTFQESDPYAEICGMYFQTSKVFVKLFSELLKHAANKSCRYVVGIAHPSLNKIYKVVIKKLGYDFQVFEDIKLKPNTIYGSNKLNLEFSPIVIKIY